MPVDIGTIGCAERFRFPRFPSKIGKRGNAHLWVWSQSKTGCASRSRDHCHRDADHINPEVSDQGDWHRLTAVLFAHVDVRRKSPCPLKSAVLAERLKIHHSGSLIIVDTFRPLTPLSPPRATPPPPASAWRSSPAGAQSGLQGRHATALKGGSSLEPTYLEQIG